MIKNKKGDVPITILVIGVVAICGFALFSFLNVSFNARQKFTGITEMNDLNYQINEYNFYRENGLSKLEIESIMNLENGKIHIEKTRKKFFGLGKEEFLFSVEHFPK